MVVIPCIDTRLYGIDGREYRHSVRVDSFDVEDTAFVECRIHDLAYAPAAVEDIEDILEVHIELKSVGRLACLHLEVMGKAYIKPVNPW